MEIRATVPQIDKHKIEQAVKMILEAIGEDINREGLIETPRRVAKAYAEIFKGYNVNEKEILGKQFDAEFPQDVEVKGITFFSVCEHHLLPFFGICNIKYRPKKKVVGLSKLNRIVQAKASKLQIQERLTYEIAKAIKDNVECEFVEVEIEARHLCVEMRGIKDTNSNTVTSIRI